MTRSLEAELTQRTRELSEANQELRKRQRDLEKAYAELKRLDELKSEFVSLVSHELRAPLTNISGSLQLLLDDAEAQSLSAKQREMITLASAETDRLTRLVKGVLNVARIESGEMQLKLTAFDVSGVIGHVIEQWQICATDHAWIGPTAQNLPSVLADRDRVEEVLMNLLDNAYKYSSVGGTVRVDLQVAADRVIVSVSDKGQGINPAELDKIFDKFHRVERGDARATYGYGLGLYISRKLIREMGGELWAESRVGEGSTFYFSLCLAGAPAPAVS
jgi:signal transduction histidine kinase